MAERVTLEPVILGRVAPLQRDPAGRAILVALPRRVARMEAVAGDLFEVLGALTVTQLQALQPTGPYVPLIDALIAARQLMGGEGSR